MNDKEEGAKGRLETQIFQAKKEASDTVKFLGEESDWHFRLMVLMAP